MENKWQPAMLPAPTARAAHARQESARGEDAHQFLRGRQGNAGLGGELGRAQASGRGPAGGGGHQDDRIIGEVAKAHV